MEIDLELVKFIKENMIDPVVNPILERMERIEKAIEEQTKAMNAFQTFKIEHRAEHDKIDERLNSQGKAIGRVEGCIKEEEKEAIESQLNAGKKRAKTTAQILQMIMLWLGALGMVGGFLYGLINFIHWAIHFFKIGGAS